MSHQATIACDDVGPADEKHLVAGLKVVFGEDGVEVHDKPQKLRLYNGTEAEGETEWGIFKKCHIIVRKAALEKALGHRVAANDLGYRRTEDGKYEMFMDAAGFTKELQESVWLETQVAKATAKVKAMGYKAVRSVGLDGRTIVKAEKLADKLSNKLSGR